MELKRTRSVIRAAEQALIGGKPLRESEDVFRAYLDELLLGPWLVLCGLKILFRRLGWGFLIAGTFILVMSLVERAWSWDYLIPSIILGAGSVYFGLPSRIAISSGVTTENISGLAQNIRAIATDEKELSRLNAGVQLVRGQAMERLGRFNVLAGIAWAALFWYASSHVLAPNLPSDIVRDGLGHTLAAILVFTFLLVIASSYAAAVRAVYQTLDFALLDAQRRSQ